MQIQGGNVFIYKDNGLYAAIKRVYIKTVIEKFLRPVDNSTRVEYDTIITEFMNRNFLNDYTMMSKLLSDAELPLLKVASTEPKFDMEGKFISSGKPTDVLVIPGNNPTLFAGLNSQNSARNRYHDFLRDFFHRSIGVPPRDDICGIMNFYSTKAENGEDVYYIHTFGDLHPSQYPYVCNEPKHGPLASSIFHIITKHADAYKEAYENMYNALEDVKEALDILTSPQSNGNHTLANFYSILTVNTRMVIEFDRLLEELNKETRFEYATSGGVRSPIDLCEFDSVLCEKIDKELRDIKATHTAKGVRK